MMIDPPKKSNKKKIIIVSAATLIVLSSLIFYAFVNSKIFFFGANTTDEFNDGRFESGDFKGWTGTTTAGGSTLVTSAAPYEGIYSAQFTVNGGGGVRRAYCYMNLQSISSVHASAYIQIKNGLPIADDHYLWLIQLVDSDGSVLASYGTKSDSKGSGWAVQFRGWPYAITTIAPGDGWHLIDAFYTNQASGRNIVMYVDGSEVVSLTQDSTGGKDVTTARFGICAFSGNSTAKVYADSITIREETPP